jgi:hypothetical protein
MSPGTRLCRGSRAQAVAILDFDEIVMNCNESSFIPNFKSSSNLESIFDSVGGGIQDIVPFVLGLLAL